MNPTLQETGILGLLTPSDQERQVIHDSLRFATEDRGYSWWCFWITALMGTGLLSIAAIAPWWPTQMASALLASLVMVRAFILYHDFMHGSLLRRSWFAGFALHLYGCMVLAPPRSWRKSHNFHHGHVGQVILHDSGSFPLMTTDMWRKASFFRRLAYRFNRSPIVMVAAYPLVFGWSLTVEPFIRSPRKHWDSAVALVLHAGIIVVLWLLGGLAMAFYGFVLPVAVAAMLGTYLFYIQHTYPGGRVLPANEWTNGQASLQTSSYLGCGRILRWITGNIGFHHVHHLNLSIPFYRLEETMDAIPSLQRPPDTTLCPRDILACLRLKLWSEEEGRLVGYAEARVGSGTPPP